MVIDWNSPPSQPDHSRPPIRAAEYVRMSTEHQRYSTDNQSAEIRRYAEQRGYEIVRTYADEGKSGLKIEGRAALRQLLSDIDTGDAAFDAVLVYDVSRWGRFQDPDEAAAYELHCKRAGIAVHYCAEQFENDGTIGSSLMKTVKRVMAGEYSRDLSVKVFAGQSNLISLGFRQGGPPGFGLRRMLVDQSGTEKGMLQRGEHKSIATDRVILVLGPSEEVAIVRDIYRRFLEGETERQIAAILNAKGVVTDLGRSWTRGSVHQVLINDKYAGHNVWARTSFKLKQQHVRNDPQSWIRSNNVFAPIVAQQEFDQVSAIIAARSQRLSDDDMLELLRTILAGHGMLSGLIIDEYDTAPSSSAYRSRFGSLLRAYSLVGFSPDHDYRYIEINRALRAMYPGIYEEIISGIRGFGAEVRRVVENDLLIINNEISLAVTIARCKLTVAGNARWKIRLENLLKPDLTLCVRMDASNLAAHDYYILPRIDMQEAVLRLAEHNGLSLDAYRFTSLEALYELTSRAQYRKAA
jgi:DNA invertase Pin-like site-specific DNA recombinase